ncbi:MAG: formylmethanofuran dehydrogenase [Clostridia bacterium]|nr:formylmethanofuran dehydrogenase [Clostridia bacterium]
MKKELWDQAVSFHGHECPGLAIGVRACEAVMERMGFGPSSDEEIVCVTENDACGVDAIQAILSCTMGKGNLIYRGTGKQAFSFYHRHSGRKLRLYLKAERDENMESQEWRQYLLNAPLEDIFEFSSPKFTLPEKARLFRRVDCEVCGEGAAEHKMRLQDGKKVCMDCLIVYDRGW